MYIERIADGRLTGMLDSRKVIIILGARQVGKTTLVKHVLRNRRTVCLNFDIEPDKQRFKAAAALSPSAAVVALGSPEILVLDEAQRMPEASRIVKGWYDAEVSAKMLLLGSSSLDILSQSVESLTGRNEKLHLPPLLFEEVLRKQAWYAPEFSSEQLCGDLAAQVNSLMMQSLVFGLYPEVVTSDDMIPLLLNLSADYLWKDILQLCDVRSPERIKKLLMLLAHQAGSEVSVNELATQLQIARPTIERYLDMLEQVFVIFRLPAFSTNPRKEICKSRKFYFWDTGIRNALLNEFSTSVYRGDIGALWENWVVAEFAKQNLLTGGINRLYFWRSRAGSEVDLVVKMPDGLKAYEIKWSPGKSVSRAFEKKYGVSVQVVNRLNFPESLLNQNKSS